MNCPHDDSGDTLARECLTCLLAIQALSDEERFRQVYVGQPADERCGNCRFWGGALETYCRQGAPKKTGAQWRGTHMCQWCGDWEPVPGRRYEPGKCPACGLEVARAPSGQLEHVVDLGCSGPSPAANLSALPWRTERPHVPGWWWIRDTQGTDTDDGYTFAECIMLCDFQDRTGALGIPDERWAHYRCAPVVLP